MSSKIRYVLQLRPGKELRTTNLFGAHALKRIETDYERITPPPGMELKELPTVRHLRLRMMFQLLRKTLPEWYKSSTFNIYREVRGCSVRFSMFKMRLVGMGRPTARRHVKDLYKPRAVEAAGADVKVSYKPKSSGGFTIKSVNRFSSLLGGTEPMPPPPPSGTYTVNVSSSTYSLADLQPQQVPKPKVKLTPEESISQKMHAFKGYRDHYSKFAADGKLLTKKPK